MTSLSAENRIMAGLRDLNISIKFFAGLADGVGPSWLSQALNGTRRLDNQQGEMLLRLLAELRELSEEHQPVFIDWRNPSHYRQILLDRRAEKERQEFLNRTAR